MRAKPTLTVERLRELLNYHPTTGIFRWRVNRRGHAKVGDVAGCVSTRTNRTYGWRQIKVDGVIYRAHRLAWLYVYGVWPRTDLDHVNRVRDDNRISNLREDLDGQNQHNQTNASRQSRSGFLGVHPQGTRWVAQITAKGCRYSLGYFDTPEEASIAYFAAKRNLHPFWRPGPD